MFFPVIDHSILQQLKIPDYPFDQCKEKYFKKIDPQKHICAGGEQGNTIYYCTMY